MNYKVFTHLNQSYLKNFYNNLTREDLFHGYLVIAVDGSKAEVPASSENIKQFGERNREKGNIRTLVSCITDVFNNLTLDMQLGSIYDSESELALMNIQAAKEIIEEIPMLLLFDRGYPEIELMNRLNEAGIKYIFRLASNDYKNERSTMIKSDETVKLKHTSARLAKIRKKHPDAAAWLATIDYTETRIVRTSTPSEMEMAFASLLDYVQSRGYELIYSHSDVRLKEHDSLVISNNKWKWFSRNVGGGTLDFLIEYEGKSFKEAMQTLIGEKGNDEKKPQYKEYNQNQHQNADKNISELPEKNSSYKRMYAYLNKTRCIDVEIINDLVNSKNLYEENCVFLGRNKVGEVKYCLKIGTNTFKKFKGEIPGSDKSFNVELYSLPENSSVCVYESIIDTMSHATLLKQRGASYNNKLIKYRRKSLLHIWG